MIVSVLASGSSGNSTFIESKAGKILVDVGTNLSYIKDELTKINFELKDINYVFISHTHSDHTKGLKSLIKKYHPTILLSELMLNDLDYLANYDNLILYEQNMLISDLTIEFIKTSHDVSDSRGFIFTENEKSIVYMTDTGYINSRYFEQLKNREIYIMESNHDIEMLINGKYQKWLQNRILSDVGHLSNSASSYYLSRFIGPRTKLIILAHLSRDNNTEEMALTTINNMLKEYHIDFNNILVAKPYEQTGVIEL